MDPIEQIRRRRPTDLCCRPLLTGLAYWDDSRDLALQCGRVIDVVDGPSNPGYIDCLSPDTNFQGISRG